MYFDCTKPYGENTLLQQNGNKNITVKKNGNIAEYIFLLILTIVPLLFLYSIVHSAIFVKEDRFRHARI